MPASAKRPRSFGREVAGLLRARLAYVGHRQQWLADRIDASQSQLSKVLRAERVMDLDQFAALCDALDVDPIDVLRQARTTAREELRTQLDQARRPPDDGEDIARPAST